MQADSLKRAEIFAFLAALFLIGVVLSEQQRLENPPIIILSEKNEDFRFPSGSAEVPSAFVKALQQEIIPELDRLSKRYQCDSIEIIGHTDGVPVTKSVSNMDYITHNVRKSVPGSNLDLGMLRAISVMKVFEDAQNSGALGRIRRIIPYSAGQFVLPDKQLAWGYNRHGDDVRRRIEIRLLRSNQTYHLESPIGTP